WWQVEPPSEAVGWIRQDFLNVKSSTVNASLIKGLILIHDQAPVQVDKPTFATIEIKGRLMPLAEPKGNVYYELLVDGQVVYYVQNVPNLDRFKGAVVSIKGFVPTKNHQYIYPVLRIINISLLL
ncbi:MAG: hypothetical protein WCH62_04355, partial [Candidatus Omnitrophota bacterium]